MRKSRYFGVALLGLLVVAAISVAAGSGRKPAKEQQGSVSLRRISSSDVMAILNQFPEMLPGRFAARKSDTGFVADLFPFTEVTSAVLGRALPGVRFYKGLDFTISPPFPYLMAIAGSTRLMMPNDFNQLLLASGLKLTDENVIELAKAFVLLAVGSEPIFARMDMPLGLDTFPPVTFLDAKRIKQDISRVTYAAKLKVRIGEQAEEWYFASWQGQLGLVSRGTADGKLIMQYDVPRAESPLQRGQLDVTPSIDISDSAPSKAYLEWQSGIPHYYLIVDTNGVADSFKVRFSLSGFPANATNVYVRVTDSIRNGAVRLLDTVHIDINGHGDYVWTPRDDSTGICKVEADTLGLDSVYRNAGGLPLKELTLERVMDTTFPGASGETLKVYYCDQFFLHDSLDGGEAHASVFAQHAMDAMLQTWNTQVNTWNLGTPRDTDYKHQVFINDNQHWYHWVKGAWAISGPDRQIGLRYNLWRGDGIDRSYSSESMRVKVAVAHEFYHGIQWRLDPGKWIPAQWKWFEEGQARFLPSAQYSSEEFLNAGNSGDTIKD